MSILLALNAVVGVIMFIFYAYQVFYTIVALFPRKKEKHLPPKENNFAVMISARNEERVIRQLIDSIHEQTYNQELITVFVLADNCTDKTAEVAREAGAVVYERFNKQEVGKGYALNELIHHIDEDYPGEPFDGYFVFDADNVLAPNFIEEMNQTFSDGHQVVTGYRNSKNFGDSWVSAVYTLSFLHEAKYLNEPRTRLGCGCMVSGTGFLFSREIKQKNNGWPYHRLTEDTEFSIANLLAGDKFYYNPDAEFFDEQPVKFKQSWKQRLRWAKGNHQVFAHYGLRLFKRFFKGDFSGFDMAMTVIPVLPVLFLLLCTNIIAMLVGVFTNNPTMIITFAQLVANYFCGTYAGMFLIGLLTVITEWKRIHGTVAQKVGYLFAFPFFQFTFLPIHMQAMVSKVTWVPIVHTQSKTVSDILSDGQKGKNESSLTEMREDKSA